MAARVCPFRIGMEPRRPKVGIHLSRGPTYVGAASYQTQGTTSRPNLRKTRVSARCVLSHLTTLSETTTGYTRKILSACTTGATQWDLSTSTSRQAETPRNSFRWGTLCLLWVSTVPFHKLDEKGKTKGCTCAEERNHNGRSRCRSILEVEGGWGMREGRGIQSKTRDGHRKAMWKERERERTKKMDKEPRCVTNEPS